MSRTELTGDAGAEDVKSKEMIKHVNLPVVNGNCIEVSTVAQKLKSLSYPIDNGIFTYYSKKDEMYVRCGAETGNPLDGSIPIDDVGERLKLRWRPLPASSEPRAESAKEPPKKSHTKRSKERKIGEVVEKVSEWRRLYTGRVTGDGKVDKLSLEEAAKEIGIAKKTLDDYLLQLRAGKRYGFDYNQHKDEKIGALRKFVKEKKAEEGERGDHAGRRPPSPSGQDGFQM
jgi:hypothetical protein